MSVGNKGKIYCQWNADFTIFKDKQLKLYTNWRGKAYFSVQLYTGNGFHSLFSANFRKKQIVSARMIVVGFVTDYSL